MEFVSISSFCSSVANEMMEYSVIYASENDLEELHSINDTCVCVTPEYT